VTVPSYNSDLMPGMIADYGFTVMNPGAALYDWFRKNMTGPFYIAGQHTGHWNTHVQISNEEDERLLLEHHSVTKFTESHAGDMKYAQQRVPYSVALDRMQYEPIYYGDACLNLEAWIENYLLPVSHVNQLINRNRDFLHINKMRHQYGALFEIMISGAEKIPVPFEGDMAKARSWCETNCNRSYKIVTPMSGILLDEMRSAPNHVFFFEDDRDATLFKVFCG
jgi:hypothetical protein